MRIVAIVNGEVISNADVDNRRRLFAFSTGLPLNADVIDRLKQQIRASWSTNACACRKCSAARS